MTFLLIGILDMFGSALAVFLPETMDRELPDMLQDANRLNKLERG